MNDLTTAELANIAALLDDIAVVIEGNSVVRATKHGSTISCSLADLTAAVEAQSLKIAPGALRISAECIAGAWWVNVRWDYGAGTNGYGNSYAGALLKAASQWQEGRGK